MSFQSPLLIGLPGTELDPASLSLIKQVQPAGFILFSRNIVSAQQTRKLTDQLRRLSWDPPIIAIDQEGGRVTRTKEIGAPPPSAAELSRSQVPGVIAHSSELTAALLNQLGINFNCAPVLDIEHHPDRDNALRDRCWGSNSQDVISHANVFNHHHRRLKIRTCGKHFPGSGLASADPHFDLPKVEASLDELLRNDLVPFTALAPELDAIMTGHLNFPKLDPDFPASLSKVIVQGLLRDQLDYQGLALTDDLDMQAVSDRFGLARAAQLAIQAGNDLAMVCHSFDEMPKVAAALSKLETSILIDAEQRILKFRQSISPPPDFSEKKWRETNQQLFELRIKVLGEEGARKPLADGSSPVENY